MIFNANYLRGAVKIRIIGSMPERFINLCIADNILLWGITKTKEDLIAWIGLDDFFRIRPLVARSRTKIVVMAHRGLPFVVKRIKRRKMMIAGACLFIILLNVLSSYVWFVEVTGLKTMPEQTILNVASQYGLKPGAVKDGINSKLLEREILLNVPEVAWVGVTFTGTRAVIEIVEKTMPKQEDKAPANIVAGKDGVIAELIALAGQPAVKKGDTVKKGDLLIKGFASGLTPTDVQGQPQAASTDPELVRAKGIIKARVWYESYAETGLEATHVTRTGNRQAAILLKIGSSELAFNTTRDQPFAEFETEIIHKQLPGWRNSVFVVESTIKQYYEVTSHKTIKSLDDARNEAHAKAMQVVQDIIPESAQVLSRNYEVLKTTEENIVRVKVSVETIEDIGQTINISQ